MSSYFANEQLMAVAGKAKTYTIQGEKEQERYFCADCGTTLYWNIAALPDRTGIAAGCFTDNPLPSPELTVANEGKCDWVNLPDHWGTSI